MDWELKKLIAKTVFSFANAGTKKTNGYLEYQTLNTMLWKMASATYSPDTQESLVSILR